MHARTLSHAHARARARASGGRRPDLPVLIAERAAKAHGLGARMRSSIHCGIYWVPTTRQARGTLWG